MAGGSVDGASRLRIRHKPVIPHHQQIVGSRSSIGDLDLPTRWRRRRAPADHTQARHGKAVFRPDRPRVFKTATYVRTPQPPPQTNPESATFTRTGQPPLLLV